MFNREKAKSDKSIDYAFFAITLPTKAKILAFLASEILFVLLADMTALNLSDSFPFTTGVILIVVAITLNFI
ncbi:hypothetical protein RCH33_1505 [Flavobacterium daejeonense]|nr:hypothetical protein RCH33_1505 [Flavobacterium daejeonense]